MELKNVFLLFLFPPHSFPCYNEKKIISRFIIKTLLHFYDAFYIIFYVCHKNITPSSADAVALFSFPESVRRS